MDPQTVTLTAPAADKLREVLAAQQALPEDAGLRVDVVHGGCSGFAYRLALDVGGEDDRVIEQDDMRILVSDASLPYVQGASIQYVETAESSGFVVDNPNAVAACGCGSSFRMRDEA